MHFFHQVLLQTRMSQHLPLSCCRSRTQDLASANVKSLFIDAGFADWLGNKYGLDKDWSRAQINGIIPQALRTNYEISNATEGAFEQNATICASVIRDFLGGWPA